ncbi:MAG: DEAD/DEAH box helicase [Planctomycetaceae bacterium]
MSRLSRECGRVRDAAAHSLGLRHYDVQIRGGLAMHAGQIAEMQTGEGKTLTATIPAYLQASAGRHVMIATANDYLAERDANGMRPVFESLGLSVGCILAGQPRSERQQHYQCDIVYGTAKSSGSTTFATGSKCGDARIRAGP